MNDEKSLQRARQVLEAFLRAKRLRRTPERMALLERIFDTEGHFYADTLHQVMELQGYHVSLSTVYATLQLFADAGLVRRHQLGNQPTQFERSLPTDDKRAHMHVVCDMCGRVRELPLDQDAARPITRRQYAGFTPSGYEVYVHGLCGRCRRRNAKS